MERLFDVIVRAISSILIEWTPDIPPYSALTKGYHKAPRPNPFESMSPEVLRRFVSQVFVYSLAETKLRRSVIS